MADSCKADVLKEKVVALITEHCKEEPPQFVSTGIPVEVGKQVLVKTVTEFFLGEVSQINPNIGGQVFHGVLLTKVSWLASTGRFSECLKNGTFDELEPYRDDVLVSFGAVVSITSWAHALPKTMK